MKDTKEIRTEPLLKRQEVANILGVSERTVRRIKATELPVVRVGNLPRYTPEAVSAYIESKTVQ